MNEQNNETSYKSGLSLTPATLQSVLTAVSDTVNNYLRGISPNYISDRFYAVVTRAVKKDDLAIWLKSRLSSYEAALAAIDEGYPTYPRRSGRLDQVVVTVLEALDTLMATDADTLYDDISSKVSECLMSFSNVYRAGQPYTQRSPKEPFNPQAPYGFGPGLHPVQQHPMYGSPFRAGQPQPSYPWQSGQPHSQPQPHYSSFNSDNVKYELLRMKEVTDRLQTRVEALEDALKMDNNDQANLSITLTAFQKLLNGYQIFVDAVNNSNALEVNTAQVTPAECDHVTIAFSLYEPLVSTTELPVEFTIIFTFNSVKDVLVHVMEGTLKSSIAVDLETPQTITSFIRNLLAIAYIYPEVQPIKEPIERECRIR